MPLDKSNSRQAIGNNIKTEQEHGKPHKQAVAIALNTAREHGGYPAKHSALPSDHGTSAYETRYASKIDDRPGSMMREPSAEESLGIKKGVDYAGEEEDAEEKNIISPERAEELGIRPHRRLVGEPPRPVTNRLHFKPRGDGGRRREHDEHGEPFDAYAARYSSNVEATQDSPGCQEIFDVPEQSCPHNLPSMKPTNMGG